MIRNMVAAILVAYSLPATAQQGNYYTEDWFYATFKDVAEDLKTARDENKRLALIFEQAGCIYCKKLHEEVLSDPEVRDYISANFMVVQYDLWGSEEVTDIDGTVMEEREAARRWGVVFTPTIMFLDEDAGDAATVKEATVQVMPGAFGKWTTLDMFRWVREKRYEGDQHFQKWHAENLEKLRAEGRL